MSSTRSRRSVRCPLALCPLLTTGSARGRTESALQGWTRTSPPLFSPIRSAYPLSGRAPLTAGQVTLVAYENLKLHFPYPDGTPSLSGLLPQGEEDISRIRARNALKVLLDVHTDFGGKKSS